MRKFLGTLLVACAFVFASTPTYAQLDFGIVGGLNLNKISYKSMPSFSSDNRCGWYIGPKLEFTIPIVGLGIDASLQYSQRRINADDILENSSTTYKSLEIPINVRYGVGLSSLAYLFVATGPQFGFNVGSSNWVFNELESFSFKKSNVSWNIGVGAKLLSHLEIGAGYNFGITKLAKLAGVLSDGSVRNNSWQLQVAYFF